MPAQAEVDQPPASPLQRGRAAAGYGWAAMKRAADLGWSPARPGSQMYGYLPDENGYL